MLGSRPHSAQIWAEALVNELVAGGVGTVCMAPGSRSTPLVAAAAAHPGMDIVTHVDERGTAFFALGLARGSGRPAAWLTTSGTAVANGLPAVVEAAADGIPMVLLTADRPHELRGSGANQTIHQPGLFGSYLRYQVDLPVPDNEVSPRFARDTVALALAHATSLPAGPVHLNCPFRKPLEPASESVSAGAAVPVTHYAPAQRVPDVSVLASALDEVDRGVVLAGRMDGRTATACRELAQGLGWPLLADVTSQLLLGPSTDRLVRHADLIVGPQVPAPDAVIQVGRMPVSERVTGFLAEGTPKVWAVLADGPDRIDPHHVVTHRLADARPACAALRAAVRRPADPAFVRAWTAAATKVEGLLAAEVLGGGLTEPAVATAVSQDLPQGHALMLASSMPVRDMNSFSAAGAKPLLVAANRGASGIDGTICTAAGVAAGLNLPVTAIIGDLAFLHDLNGLALASRYPVTLVVVNNDGGGIFSFLPIANHKDIFEPYFGTPHGLRFRAAADLFGIAYHMPKTLKEFRETYQAAARSGVASIIEITTERGANLEEHQRLRDLVDEWVRKER